MEDRRRGSEASSRQASEDGEDDEQVDTGETSVERNGVRDQAPEREAPVEMEDGGGLGEVSLPMEDHSGEEGGGEDVVDQELQKRFFVRCAVRTLFVHVIFFLKICSRHFFSPGGLVPQCWPRCC